MAYRSQLSLTRDNINNLGRLVGTETVRFPNNPVQDSRMIDGITETAMNRAISPQFSNRWNPGVPTYSVEDVANQPSQFTGIDQNYNHDVTSAPLASPSLQRAINSHVFDLASGAAPTFPGVTHYLNPNFSTTNNIAPGSWGAAVMSQNQPAGVGRNIHFYGNAPGTNPVTARPDLSEADMQGLAQSKLGIGLGMNGPIAADSADRANDYGSTAFNNVHPSLMASIAAPFASLATPFSAVGNAIGGMFANRATPTSPTNVGASQVASDTSQAVAPTPQRPVSYSPLDPAPTLGSITSKALAALPSQMPARVASQTPLIVGAQVADTPPATAPSYAEGTLGHLLSRPQSPVMASMAPSMPMTRVTAMPSSTPAFAPAPQQPPSLPATAFASTAPQTAPQAPQAPQQQTGQWVSDLKAMDADESARRTAALTSPVTAPAAFSMPSRPISPTPTAPTPSLQAPSMSPSATPSISQGVNAIQSLASGMPSLSTMGQYAGLALGSPLAGAMPAVSTLGALAAPVAGALTAPQGPVNSSVIGTPTVPGTNLPVGDPANPVNGPPVAPPSTLNKIMPTLGDIKTGLVGAKIGMGAGPIGAAAGFAIPVLGGIANRLGYGLNSPFFGGPTPNPGASPATQADVVAHAAPSVLAQVNRMGYGALPAGSDYHYGYSPFGSGISLVNNNDTEAHQIAATGPGLLGALGFGGPASAPSLAAQAAAARTAAANDAVNTAAAANASQGNGNGNNPSGMNKGFGSSTNSNGRNGRNKNDNGNN